MKFTAAFLALIPLVAAIPPVFERSADVVDASNSTQLEARIQGNVFVCVDAGFTGNCGVFHGASGQCISFGPDFNDDISAVGPDSGQDCFFFIDGDCLGAQLGPIRNPGIPNLNVPPNVQFNDQISSFKCFFG
ncbi:hypothetical protein R3P38DRAFT_3608439 [Favolaschia claudopus]|uniref:Uncharacterized protein n=1 Tax=Favolaschia claudopus TaxID=2862362 RepID=A0AAW0DH64_9AGAR